MDRPTPDQDRTQDRMVETDREKPVMLSGPTRARYTDGWPRRPGARPMPAGQPPHHAPITPHPVTTPGGPHPHTQCKECPSHT